MTIPATTRLDNAALIYPPCKTDRYSSLFRISVTLTSPVAPALLQTSLDTVLGRFPGFSYTIARNFFWWYLRRIEGSPRVCPTRPLPTFDYEKNGGFLFRVSYEDRRIDLDVFHALTDGTGAMTFLMSLAAEYVREACGGNPGSGKWVLNPDEEPCAAEFEDSFDHFSGRKGSLEKLDKAYHIDGTVESWDVLNRVRLTMSASKVRAVAQSKNCTVTELLTSAMLSALQEVRSAEPFDVSPFIRIDVPVNLRPIFGRKTLRNFSSYVNLGIDVRNGNLGLDEIINIIKPQKSLYTQPRELTGKVAANVALEDNKAIAALPLFIKKPVMSFIYRRKGDRFCTNTFSNLGRIALPEGLAPHVRSLDFILGRPLGKSGSAACVTYGDTLVLNVTRKIREDDFERALLRRLLCLGIRPAIRRERASLEGTSVEDIMVLP